ncbi:hypothetical protein Q8G42_00115 [Acinetobacter lwoffii]|uniref:Uncharacterized protein n=1 Tax=Acinetobacter lwoffii TaxID=28090 RepID=A0AAW8ASS4_ACILW|nr:hypothetical protein [Acinetobacter lwoffii]MDP1369194.1 hypothetical protein [Acinetobacter lwoffii]MDP1388648.1 hypothetical protein [Acinetobacter lwoffii]MDP1446362.1 hypothetical protein [Acinetobacter lwoffii]
MKLIVYRDENGVVQNIGDWDYMITKDEDGLEIVNNPLPDGVTSKIEEVKINEDGSRAIAHDM